MSDYLTQEELLTFQGSTTILLTSALPEALAIETLATAVINGAPHMFPRLVYRMVGYPPDDYGEYWQSTDDKYPNAGLESKVP